MMHSEFCEISGQEVSYKAYKERFEPMYISLDIEKHEFIKFMMPVIQEVAKHERLAHEAEQRRRQKLVFVSNGIKTPNWCYYYGHFFKMVGCDIRTGKALVRELTNDEFRTEVAPYYSADCHSFYDFLEEQVKVVKK